MQPGKKLSNSLIFVLAALLLMQPSKDTKMQANSISYLLSIFRFAWAAPGAFAAAVSPSAQILALLARLGASAHGEFLMLDEADSPALLVGAHS